MANSGVSVLDELLDHIVYDPVTIGIEPKTAR